MQQQQLTFVWQKTTIPFIDVMAIGNGIDNDAYLCGCESETDENLIVSVRQQNHNNELPIYNPILVVVALHRGNMKNWDFCSSSVCEVQTEGQIKTSDSIFCKTTIDMEQ